jgi:anti-sigma factor RsiW
MNHKQAWDLIPWFVNGSAPESRSEELQRHMEECQACQGEVAAQRSLMQAMKTRPLVENMPHGSLQKLWTRIDAVPARPSMQATPRHRSPRATTWMAAAIAVQALMLGALTVFLLRSPRAAEDAPFRTVSTPSAVSGAASVRAVFSPDMTLGELQALLERARLRIVNGPTPEGVYTLATTQPSPAADPKAALVTLRSHPSTRFAEPIGPSNADRPSP